MISSIPSLLSCSAAIAVFASAALAQAPRDSVRAPGDSAQASGSSSVFHPNLKPSIQAVRIDTPIKVDGDLTEPAWQNATKVANFAQWNPTNLERPPVETEAMLAYDSDNLYVAVIAYDDPRSVRANMRDRDQIYQDDFVGLFIDTMGDGSWAYEIWSNPLGVQGDILWTPTSEDDRFDMVFSSKGKITERGYQVEMAIPFSSLRFPNKDVQTWRTTFWRNHPRSSRGQYSWAAISRSEPCWQCQWGTMTGIQDVHGSGNLEMLPYVTASQKSVLRNPTDLTSGLHDGDPDADAGLNLRYTFTSIMSAAAAINPDFSQVESDAAQVDVNTTFALFYPEKRPIFQEGTDLIQTNIQAIYTRSINDPSVAARFTARAHRSSFVTAVARDEHSPFLLPFEEESAVTPGGKSTTTLARFRQILGQESNAGFLLTDRRMDDGGSGTTYGVDGTLRFLRNYRFEWQALGSHTNEPVSVRMSDDINGQLVYPTFDHGKHTAAFDGETYSGAAYYGGFRRDGKVWNAEALYHQ